MKTCLLLLRNQHHVSFGIDYITSVCIYIYFYNCNCSLMLTLRIPLLYDSTQTSALANPLCNYSSINKQRGCRPLHVLCRR